MKILYASTSPLAGVCELMARSILEYFPEHEAAVLNKGPGKHGWYCREGISFKRWSVKNKDHIAEALEWADVIHCMANFGVRRPEMGPFDKEGLIKSKKWVYQWHGAQIWPFRNVWAEKDYQYVTFIHIGQGWVETQMDFFAPFFEKWGAKVVPNIISADDILHRPIPWENRKDRIGFAPSNRGHGVNRKGILEVRTSVQGFQRDFIVGVPFELCLQRKQKCRLGIDEVVTPMYHRSGLEFLSQGTPCICSYTPDTERVLKDATGTDTMPFINAKPDTLKETFKEYFNKTEEERIEMSVEARRWVDVYYHPSVLLEKYLDLYK